ncbi:VanW family protein [Entomospira culicis]|uniref:VanW family protein n=1 Tax=Entomospira culicis TaxID=2719989 RepID=A0A968GLM6_9SPIO|nr:VanW family protein [Entomospira culicis]NIZ19846.1 VanW family protein [Entomospira culicis]NIZ70060.1 VanW family protein [Entomospira culicis]WDI38793.1 VanW family protein [Entomospira culicis]
MPRKRLTQIFPFLLPIRKRQRALFYKIGMRFDRHTYASTLSDDKLEKRIFTHKSLLLRKLGDTDMQLQINKVTNLKIASSKISHVLIKPNEVFSFWHLVGDVSPKQGYKDGIFLSDGAVKVASGGGLCQLANLLFWIFLHTPLEIVERYRHGFDPFPDYGRVIPFGTGATLVHGWKDIKVKNPTNLTFQVNLWFDETYIHGDIRANDYPPHSYHIVEKNHRFVQKSDGIYRQNQIYRQIIDRRTGNHLGEEHLFDNDSLTKYDVAEELICIT